jgi:hypothetical protein
MKKLINIIKGFFTKKEIVIEKPKKAKKK